MAGQTQRAVEAQTAYAPGILPVLSDHNLAPSKKWRGAPSREQMVASRKKAWDALGLSLEHSIWTRQVHGDRVWVVGSQDMGSGAYGDAEVEADAIICPNPDPYMNLAIKGADCPTLALRCIQSGAIGVVHAGVAGQMNGIIATTVEQMVHLGAGRDTLEVFVGPFISHYHYRHPRYGERIRFFCDRSCAYLSGGYWHIDQEEVIRQELRGAGIDPKNIFFDGRCTYDSPHLISHTQMRERNKEEDGAFQRGNNVMLIGGCRTISW
ncbi:MAG: polyphenol oxidase family protein [Patescibacteria group bacterium]